MMEGSPRRLDYEVVEIDFPGQIKKERVKIPTGPSYGEEVKRLSRKAHRGQPFAHTDWSEGYGVFLRWKERSATIGPITYAIREAHIADESPESSLVEVQVLTSFNSGNMGETLTRSFQQLTYYPDTDKISVLQFDRITDEDTAESLTEAAKLRGQVDPIEPEPKHKAFLYTTLVWVAGERLAK